jgi:hypothetical protein
MRIASAGAPARSAPARASADGAARRAMHAQPMRIIAEA